MTSIITGFQKIKDREDKDCVLWFAKDRQSGPPPFYSRIFYDITDKDENGKTVIIQSAKDAAEDFDRRVCKEPDRFYQNPEKFW